MTATTIRASMLAVLLALAALLAGCAAPEETGEPVSDPILDDDEERVRIDGNVYRCSDTIRTGPVCEEWQLDEDGAEGATIAAEAQSREDGAVEMFDHVFVCDDVKNIDVDVTDDGGESQVGACEQWVRQSEA